MLFTKEPITMLDRNLPGRRFEHLIYPLGLVACAVLAIIVAVAIPAFVMAGPTYTADLIYGHADGVDLKMDIAQPRCGDGPFSAVVCIHGGAWAAGAKMDIEGYVKTLASKGFVAANVEYRLAPAYKWPAQIEDCKCAVRYLRAHAKELNIDPNRIYASGFSAGGHLSLMLGLMGPKDGLEGEGGNPGVSSAVQAVANFYGPTDMRVWNLTPKDSSPEAEKMVASSKDILVNVWGTSDRNAPILAQASPITYVDAQDPPIISFHGTKDDIVDLSQAQLLHNALEKTGVPQELVVMENMGHGWGGKKFKDSVKRLVDFFEANSPERRGK
jgi:acetyl esterase/lipase